MTTTTLTLHEAQQKYSNSMYTHLIPQNIEKIKKNFLSSGCSPNPILSFGASSKQKKLELQLDSVIADKKIASRKKVIAFLDLREQEIRTLLILLSLHEDPQNKIAAKTFRINIAKLYGVPDTKVVGSTLNYLKVRANDTHTQKELDLLLSNINLTPIGKPYIPRQDTFDHYKKLLSKIYPKVTTATYGNLNGLSGYNIEKAFEAGLKDIKANRWKVVRSIQGSNVRVSYRKKHIYIGKEFRPTSPKRLHQIVCHEVIGHVLPYEKGNQSLNISQNEGRALLIEQLSLDHFVYKRMIRYLAIALAWGVDGTMRDFKTTHHLVKLIFMIINKLSEQEASERAFNETLRGFRLGHPSIPGVIFTKDQHYFTGNLAIWRKLEQRRLPYGEFVEFIHGHATITQGEMNE